MLSASIFSFMVLVSSCGPTLTVTNDYDHTANFRQYKTFKIVKLEQQYQSLNQLNQDRIISAVNAQMVAKGFTQSDNADLLVNITSILKNKSEIVANTYQYGGFYRPYMWGGGNMSTTVNVENYTAGSLIIEVASSANNKLLWEGIGNQDIDGSFKNPETAVPAIVAKIMASFPPGMMAGK